MARLKLLNSPSFDYFARLKETMQETGQDISKLFKMGKSGLFLFIFVFSIQLTENVQYNFLPMIGFDPRTSVVRLNHGAL